ncbi:CDP-diacylglycerol-serine O-phosphatidyltransferase, partial [Smittium mucronatum]
LARYNTTVASLPKDSHGKIRYFEGTPIPSNLLIVALLAYGVFTGKFWDFKNVPKSPDGFISPFKLAFVGENVWFGEIHVFNTNFTFHPFVLIYIVSGILMVSKRLRIPKF